MSAPTPSRSSALLAALAVTAAAAARPMLPRHVVSQRPVNDSPYAWMERNYTQFVDQFNFGPVSGLTFPQRYLINDTWWSGPGGAIAYYAGNEGFIDLFAANTGFQWTLCQELRALCVFGEHRYYGTSLPFGEHAYDNVTTLAYLSSEQALMDHVSLVESLKANLSATTSPVILFGGSYGGMLAAWAMLKNPGHFAGAIAASAPITQFMGQVDPRLYTQTIANDFKAANPASFDQIAASWGIMGGLAGTQAGRDHLQGALRVCDKLTSPDWVTNVVFNWVSSALGYMAMADYPYPANFLGPMPAYPVSVAANYFNVTNPTDDDVLHSLYLTMNLFLNYTGQAGDCFELSNAAPPGLTQNGWDYQCCTEVVQSLGQYGPPTDFFFPAPFNFTATVQGCQAQYNGATPRATAGFDQYGGPQALRFAKNILFSQGTLDPWSRLGPMANITGNPDVSVVVIEGGAHHLDLRAPNPADPQSVVDARNMERAAIRKWIAQWHAAQGTVDPTPPAQ